MPDTSRRWQILAKGVPRDYEYEQLAPPIKYFQDILQWEQIDNVFTI